MRSVDIHGFPFLVEPEPSDYWDWIESGHYRADFDTITRFAWPEVNCIDLGAWVGAYTLYASRIFKQVYAVEPDPVAFRMLSANVQANNLANVTLFENALMGHSGTTTIGSTILGCSCTRESCHENSVIVPCVTLREFCRDIPDPLFIKMDVEGAEAKVLEDFAFFSERKPDLMLSTHMEWWKESGSDGKAEFNTINRVGKLYSKAVHQGSNIPVDLCAPYGDVVFTDKQ